MQIIPVIDLRKGIVVHAVKGDREKYQAIDSKLCSSADPLDVINGYLTGFKHKSIYIADLDALENQGNHIDTIDSICNKYPDIEFWLDTGSSLLTQYLQNTSYQNLRLVLSSESLISATIFYALIDQYPQHNFILSLDYKFNKLLGPKELFLYKNKWPKDVIILNLDNVGIKQGYQIPTELNQEKLTNNFNIYYGGGIKDINDVNNLKSFGLTGALISTALHNQAITNDDICLLN
jgi:phosphoribosylformimino-5-aminoimidazole carboxamide ribotide isomerase